MLGCGHLSHHPAIELEFPVDHAAFLEIIKMAYSPALADGIGLTVAKLSIGLPPSPTDLHVLTQ